jgi:hypothetical protein
VGRALGGQPLAGAESAPATPGQHAARPASAGQPLRELPAAGVGTGTPAETAEFRAYCRPWQTNKPEQKQQVEAFLPPCQTGP